MLTIVTGLVWAGLGWAGLGCAVSWVTWELLQHMQYTLLTPHCRMCQPGIYQHCSTSLTNHAQVSGRHASDVWTCFIIYWDVRKCLFVVHNTQRPLAKRPVERRSLICWAQVENCRHLLRELYNIIKHRMHVWPDHWPLWPAHDVPMSQCVRILMPDAVCFLSCQHSSSRSVSWSLGPVLAWTEQLAADI